jgi:hypothetical protein
LQGKSIERPAVILGMDLLRRSHAIISYRPPCLYVRQSHVSPELRNNLHQSLIASGFVAVDINGIEEDVMFVDGEIAGKAARFRIDTGGFATLLDQEQAHQYKLENRKARGKVVDLGGHQEGLRTALLPRFSFGSYQTTNFPVGLARMPRSKDTNKHLRQQGEPGVVGLLGPDFLLQASALIDCAGGKLYLLPQKSPPR